MTLPMHDPLAEHSTVAVLGYGASGRAATRLLRRLGKSVIVADQGLTEAPSVEGVTFHAGSHDIGDATAVILSPSFNPEWPENRTKTSLRDIFSRMDRGELTVMSEVELGIRAWRRPVIAVGGTDGKSTTAALTHALGPAFDVSCVLGGNSWQAFSDVALDAPDDAEVAVVEISAFQLHRPHHIHPNVAIFTNLAFDHLDHYANFEDYAAAKFSMFQHQGEGDAAVFFDDAGRAHAQAHHLQNRGVEVLQFQNSTAHQEDGGSEDQDILTVRWNELRIDVPFDAIRLKGAHNRRNVMAALLSWMLLLKRMPDEAKMREILGTFSGLPHRVAHVRTLDDVAYVDDSKATNVHAACVGIRSMSQPIVAIVGGVDKGLDLAPLWDALAEHGKLVIAIGELQSRIVEEAPDVLRVRRAASMEEAVQLAQAEAEAGDVVMLSPASSSFDMFASFSARGDQYAQAVLALDSRS